MKIFLLAAVVLILGLSLTGCVSVKQNSAFRNAGSPTNSKATLLIGYHFSSVKVDGENVSMLGRGMGTSAWILEMLPGQHQVEVVWGRHTLSGSFTAENGMNYALASDSTSVWSGGLQVRELRSVLYRAYIVELPATYKRSLGQKLGYVETKGDEEFKTYKKVGDLRPIETK